MSDEFDDLFSPLSKGPATARLSDIGDTAQGIIFKRERKQETDDEGNVVMNQWNKPKPLVVLWIATSLRDPENPDDDGARRLWLKGNGLWTLQEFIRVNDLKPPAIGGKVKVWVESLKPNAIKTRKPMKVHGAMYADPKPEWIAQAQEFAARWERPAVDEFDASFDERPAAKKSEPAKSTLDSMRGFDDDEPPF